MFRLFHDLDESIVRYILRKRRKEKNLRQEDISGLSPATISNIERGRIEEVSRETILYYLGMLDLKNIDELTTLVNIEAEKIDNLASRLESIEAMIDDKNHDEADKLLTQIDIEKFHPLTPFVHFLKGRCFYERKEVDKAEENYHSAIRLCKQQKLEPRDNIVAICYNELSILCYNQNNINKALEYADKGLNEFNENKEKKDIKYALYNNKILCLLKRSETDMASQILNEVWPMIPEIDSIRVILNLYKFKSIILRQKRDYDTATQICKEGIEIARRNRNQNRHLDLLNVLGSIYLLEKKYEKAEQHFMIVLESDPKQKYTRRLVDAHTYLGLLYTSQKQLELADYHLAKAIELGRNIHDIYRLTKALIVYGNYFLSQRKYEKAASFYEEAAELTEKYSYKHRQHTALLNLIHCLDIMKKEEATIKYLKKHYALQRDLKIQSEEDEIYELE
ncbi:MULTISPECIES: helix-turn-helix domain-containing protein [Thermoactinomyces]|uniref:Helix-turn-helix domain-containing protein n=1 Tax=Thermoactinomyces daqus TaxID=1329516 RepID=A0A7W1XCZ0_9BACL|nr:helix-turn-helix domain-containing protein [Thermoactinomyces daqus]MBA4544385.1 helix-turn-helix domain-containing protein [Thermoactinomyces daqus]MBH8609082.1 helix-turn-helix domain-containing protein [Thermoactinomyces sp. CICC 10521]